MWCCCTGGQDDSETLQYQARGTFARIDDFAAQSSSKRAGIEKQRQLNIRKRKNVEEERSCLEAEQTELEMSDASDVDQDDEAETTAASGRCGDGEKRTDLAKHDSLSSSTTDSGPDAHTTSIEHIPDVPVKGNSILKRFFTSYHEPRDAVSPDEKTSFNTDPRSADLKRFNTDHGPHGGDSQQNLTSSTGFATFSDTPFSSSVIFEQNNTQDSLDMAKSYSRAPSLRGRQELPRIVVHKVRTLSGFKHFRAIAAKNANAAAPKRPSRNQRKHSTSSTSSRKGSSSPRKGSDHRHDTSKDGPDCADNITSKRRKSLKSHRRR